jgi:Mce-associated membrane protein
MRVTTDSVVESDDREGDEQELEQAAHPADVAGHAGDSVAEDDPEAGSAPCDDTETQVAAEKTPSATRRFKRLAINRSRALAFGLLPIMALGLGTAAAFLKWQDLSTRSSVGAAIESVSAAKESTVAMLSYQPEGVEKELEAAQGRMTGAFKDSYSQLIHDVVIPGAKKQHISAIATIAAASSISATPNHAVALLFVNQTATVGDDSPTETASAVRVTLDKKGGRWLISGFEPV